MALPIPQASTYYIVINGQQSGPYDLNTLKTMAAQNQLTKETLVWKEGMTTWSQAVQVAELNNIFGSIPPPIPGQ